MIAAESGLAFTCEGERLFGILHRPQRPSGVGVVVIVGGPQYRVGSHRQFVLLARALALRGHAVLRFDYRGMGDSEGAPREFMELNDDVQAAVDALCHAAPEVQRVVIWGLCSGATAALLHWHECRDARVAGLCLVNPWVRSFKTLARTRVKHYYGQRLLEREFWVKLLRGGVARQALSGLLQNLGTAFIRPSSNDDGGDYRLTMARAWAEYPGPVLLVLCSRDYTSKEFLEAVAIEPAWHGALERPRLQRLNVAGADHTFSSAAERQAMEAAVADWLDAEFTELTADRQSNLVTA